MSLNKLTDDSSNYYFFDSNQIKVFPCAYRDAAVDPESRMNTESNFTNLGPAFTYNGKNSYIISWVDAEKASVDGGLLKCVINGYYFEIKNCKLSDFIVLDGSSTTYLQYLTINPTQSIIIGGTESKITTNVLASLANTTTNTTGNPAENNDLNLDVSEKFVGLGAGPESKKGNYYLQIITDSGKIYYNSFLPEIYHGSTPSITLIDKIASKKESVSISLSDNSTTPTIELAAENINIDSDVINVKAKTASTYPIIAGDLKIKTSSSTVTVPEASIRLDSSNKSILLDASGATTNNITLQARNNGTSTLTVKPNTITLQAGTTTGITLDTTGAINLNTPGDSGIIIKNGNSTMTIAQSTITTREEITAPTGLALLAPNAAITLDAGVTGTVNIPNGSLNINSKTINIGHELFNNVYNPTDVNVRGKVLIGNYTDSSSVNLDYQDTLNIKNINSSIDIPQSIDNINGINIFGKTNRPAISSSTVAPYGVHIFGDVSGSSAIGKNGVHINGNPNINLQVQTNNNDNPITADVLYARADEKDNKINIGNSSIYYPSVINVYGTNIKLLTPDEEKEFIILEANELNQQIATSTSINSDICYIAGRPKFAMGTMEIGTIPTSIMNTYSFILGKNASGDVCNAYFSGLVKVNSYVEATYFNAVSDARLKENIKEYTCEKSILDLSVYKYDFIDGAKNQIGCLAQDLQKICPEIVQENEDGYLSIQENKLVYLLLQEVKELKEKINKLENK